LTAAPAPAVPAGAQRPSPVVPLVPFRVRSPTRLGKDAAPHASLHPVSPPPDLLAMRALRGVASAVCDGRGGSSGGPPRLLPAPGLAGTRSLARRNQKPCVAAGRAPGVNRVAWLAHYGLGKERWTGNSWAGEGSGTSRPAGRGCPESGRGRGCLENHATSATPSRPEALAVRSPPCRTCRERLVEPDHKPSAPWLRGTRLGRRYVAPPRCTRGPRPPRPDSTWCWCALTLQRLPSETTPHPLRGLA